MELKVLIVDDDHKMQSLLKEYLGQFNWQTRAHLSGKEVPAQINSYCPDIVILDMMLPFKDGLEVLRDIRQHSSVPVLMLTARGEATDRIVGLESGADDYLAKPFEPRELYARIKAICRRSLQNNTTKEKDSIEHSDQPRDLQYQSLRLIHKKRSLSDGVSEISLADSSFRLLRVFLEHPETVLDRDHIMNLTHGRDFMGYERSIDVQISKLRSILSELSNHNASIRTVWGEGYMLSTDETKD